jgi:hypothetical protein
MKTCIIGYERLEQKVEEIYNKMFSSRIDQWNGKAVSELWSYVSYSGGSGKNKYVDLIRNLLSAGFVVSSGYFCTNIKGCHDYAIFWKTHKKPKLICNDEWYHLGCFIQKNDHPMPSKYTVFKDDENQTHIGVCDTFKQAVEMCIQNKNEKPFNGLYAWA